MILSTAVMYNYLYSGILHVQSIATISHIVQVRLQILVICNSLFNLFVALVMILAIFVAEFDKRQLLCIQKKVTLFTMAQ